MRPLRSTVSCLLVLCLPAVLCAQVEFGGAHLFRLVPRPSAVAVIDWDGDGYLDVALGEYHRDPSSAVPPAVVVAHGNGRGGFDRRTTLWADVSLWRLHAADVDGDRVPDLVCGTGSYSTVALFRGEQGSTVRRELLPDSTGRPDIVSDIDADGHVDIIIHDYSTGFHVYSGSATGFARTHSFALGQGNPDIAVGDLNQDGLTDVVYTHPNVTKSDPPRHDLCADLQQPDGSWIRKWTQRCDGYSQSLALLPPGPDGRLDLLTASTATGQLHRYRGSRQGSFELEQTEETVEGPADLTIHEHGGLGTFAVVTGPSSTAWALHSLDGGLGRSQSMHAGVSSFPMDVASGDLDRDGDAELVFVGPWGGNVAVYRDPWLSSAVTLDAGALVTSLFVSDADRDGIPELNAGCDGRLVVHSWDRGAFQLVRSIPAPGSVIASATGDLDHDGAIDRMLSVAIEDERGEFHTRVFRIEGDERIEGQWSAPHAPRVWDEFQLRDFDGDRKCDLVITNPNLVVHRGRGNGELEVGERLVSGFAGGLLLGGTPVDAAVVGGALERRLYSLRRHDRGGFEVVHRLEIARGVARGSIRAIDLDRDGQPEILVPTLDGGLDVVGRRVDGTLYPRGAVELGDRPPIHRLEIADLDRDGIDDVIAFASQPSHCILLLGDGAGGFAAVHRFSLAAWVDQAIVTDLDGDGRLDLAYSSGDRFVHVALNRGGPLDRDGLLARQVPWAPAAALPAAREAGQPGELVLTLDPAELTVGVADTVSYRVKIRNTGSASRRVRNDFHTLWLVDETIYLPLHYDSDTEFRTLEPGESVEKSVTFPALALAGGRFTTVQVVSDDVRSNRSLLWVPAYTEPGELAPPVDERQPGAWVGHPIMVPDTARWADAEEPRCENLPMAIVRSIEREDGSREITAEAEQSLNGFRMGYRLRAILPRGAGEPSLETLEGIRLEYWDDEEFYSDRSPEAIARLISRLEDPGSHPYVRMVIVPGGEAIEVSPPVQHLMWCGEAAIEPLLRALGDRRTLAPAVFVLGAIGDERVIPDLVRSYPELQTVFAHPAPEALRYGPITRPFEVRGSVDSLWWSFALVNLTGEPLDRSREGHDRAGANRGKWLEWWKGVGPEYVVPEEKPNATFMPGYPVGSANEGKFAREWLRENGWEGGWVNRLGGGW